MSSTPGSGSSNKRRRRVASPCGGLHIAALPDVALAHAASYLARPSRVMFAVAVTAAPSTGRESNDTSNAILGGDPWEALDFEDVEKSLTSKLTDDDVAAILACIDARNNLKKLKLSGCVNITGTGLQLLRRSGVMEHIDLSLTGQNESPRLNPAPTLSLLVVLPILDSLMHNPDSSLRLVLLPSSWRKYDLNLSWMLRPFLSRYNNFLDRRRVQCSKCPSFCREGGVGPTWVNQVEEMDEYTTQQYICGKCTENFCNKLRLPWDSECRLHFCLCCSKHYHMGCISGICFGCNLCSGCVETLTKCPGCRKDFCAACYHTCQHCGRSGCQLCGDFELWCCNSGCDAAYCQECVHEGHSHGELINCGECQESQCSRCRMHECRVLDAPCHGCKSIADLYHSIQDEREAVDDLTTKLESNRKEINRLEEENVALQKEVEELRRRITTSGARG